MFWRSFKVTEILWGIVTKTSWKTCNKTLSGLKASPQVSQGPCETWIGARCAPYQVDHSFKTFSDWLDHVQRQLGACSLLCVGHLVILGADSCTREATGTAALLAAAKICKNPLDEIYTLSETRLPETKDWERTVWFFPNCFLSLEQGCSGKARKTCSTRVGNQFLNFSNFIIAWSVMRKHSSRGKFVQSLISK